MFILLNDSIHPSQSYQNELHVFKAALANVIFTNCIFSNMDPPQMK